MATYYYVDGKLSKNEPKTKKKKGTTYTLGENGTLVEQTPKDAFIQEDIAPVATTNNARTWFQKSKGNLLQTIAGTGVDVFENAVSSIGTMGESVIDAMSFFSSGAYASQKAQNGGMLTADDHKLMQEMNKHSSEFVKKDLYDEEKIAKSIISAPIKKVTGIDAETMSVFGEKSDALIQSGAQLLATAGLQAVGVPWFVTTGMTSFGGEAENALKQGATYEEAFGSGAITAGAEILTEKLSGGIKFGGKALDDVLVKSLSEQIANKTIRTLAKVGLNAVGEGSEEIISQIFSNLGTSLYKEESIEELLTNEEALDSYLESFIGGAVLGGGSSSISAIKSAKNGTDYVTGLTDNETKVVEKEVENRIKEKEADGTKLTNKEKSKIREQVMEHLDKGYIGIDTIESALGGETYQQYQKQSEYQQQLEDELAELDSLKAMERTGAQDKRKAEIEGILKEFKETDHVGKIKERLSTEVSELAKNSRLAESYNEQARKGQAYEADLSKYDAKQAEVVKKAVESGILNNSNRTHDFVDMISKISAEKGVLFDFTNNQRLRESGFAVDGKQVNGYVKDGNVTLNIDSAKSLESVVGHEVTHVLEGTEIYAELQKIVKEYATTKGEYDARRKALESLYDGADADIDAEITADLIGDYLFTDSDFVNRLSAEKPNVFKKIYDEVKYLCKVATAGSKEARELEKVKRAFEKAYKESGKTSSDVKYSLEKTSDGTEYVKAEKNLFLKEDGTMLSEREIFNSLVGKTFSFPDGEVKIVKRLPKKDMYNELSKRRPHHKGVEDVKKLNADVNRNMEELLTHSDAKALDEADVNNRHEEQGIISFDTRTVKFYDGSNAYDIEFSIATLQSGEKVAYAKKFFGYDEELTKKIQASEARSKSPLNQNPVTNSVTQNSENASENVKYSLSDSAGKQLTQEQQEYFKDSKVRDENGNLKVVYHGSPSNFNQFSLQYLGTNGTAEGYGFYFTDDKSIAEGYSKGLEGQRSEDTQGKLFEVYLDIKKPLSDTEVTMSRSEFKRFLTELNNQVDEDGEPLDVLSNYGDVAWEGLNKVLSYAMKVEYDGSSSDVSMVHSIINGTGQLETVLDVLRKTTGYDGIIVNDATWGGNQTIYLAFHPEQIKNVDNLNPTSNPDIRYSLGEQSKEYGNRNTYGRDIALESALSPMQETVQETAEDSTVFRSVDDYAPLTEEEANKRDDAQIEEHYFMDDMSPETEEQYNGSYADHVAPVDPFAEKDIWEVGKDRKQKAYMFENPEVKPFFQEEARYMLGELNNSQKGEKFYNDQLYYDTNGEMGWFGTQRFTSEDIAYLLDTFNYTYKQVEKGLRAIIEDNGKENNAISKRIEFLLDERLRLGYTEFIFGEKIPPNQDYINLLNAKQITEYNDDAWNNWLRGLTPEEIQEYFGVRQEEAPQPDEYVAVEPKQVTSQATENAEEVRLYEAQKRKGVVEGQQSMFEEAEAPKTVTRSVLHKNIVDKIKSTFNAKGFDFDEVLKSAKNLSTFATVDNTPQRVMEKALGYKQGQILSDLTVNQVAQNETEGIKWLDSFTNRKKGLLAQISKQYNIKPGSKESAGAQMYAEGFYVDEENNIIKYGDEELAKDFPDARVQANIKALAKDERIRRIYDETLALINKSRTRNAYPEIPRLDNYFLHFRAMDDTFSRLGLPFNPNDIRAKDLPTDLNGVTADLKPGQPYFASAMHRTGKRTSFDLLGGLERYLTSAKNQIYHIDDIQTLRALRNYIADRYGQAKGLESIDSMSEEEAQERIAQVFNSHLSTFAKFLNEEANILAGKTALIDRGLEGIIGRRGITFLDTVNRQVGSNMVGFNVSSSLTNILPVVQTFAKTNKADFVKAFSQTVSNKIGSIYGKNDGFAEQSPVMIRRKGADRFHRTPFQKVGDTGYILMSAADDISTELIARTKYNELIKSGLDSQQAHFETDKWVSRLMGDRSLGQQPQLYNSKMLGLITKFQLEVRNQLDSQFYDTIQEAKVSNEHIQNGLERNAKVASKVASTFAQLAVVQHLFGTVFESVAGYNPAFDIIGVLLTAIGSDDEEDSEDTVLDNIEQGFLELLEDLPYTSTLTGGRIPISSALPVEELVTGKDEYGNDKSRLETLGEIAPYYVLPTGYGQIKKTKQGLEMFDDDLPVSGSYTDSGNLRFPVEDTLGNRVQAGIFGQYASKNARDYFDNERNPLKEKQIQEYIDLDLPIADYWEYREGLAKQETLEDKFEYVNDMDVSTKQKNIMINNIVDRKEEVDMSNYDDFENYEEFDFYTKNKEKYEFLQDNGVSYREYKSSEDAKEEYDDIYSWWKNNPEKVAVSKAVASNVVEYRRYAKDLSKIRADKNASGKTISGSAKAKKLDYINSLDIDYGQRMILYRTIADSKEDKNRYNPQIIEYLDSREDISWEEMKTILEELDMKVSSNGSITW